MVVKIKKQKTQKCVIIRKLKFKNFKNCLKATQLDNEIKYLQKNKTDIDDINRIIKKCIKNKVQMMIKNAVNSFDRNICIWNEPRYQIFEKKKRLYVTI